MPYFDECELCGANLDPCELCECRKKEKKMIRRNAEAERLAEAGTEQDEYQGGCQC